MQVGNLVLKRGAYKHDGIRGAGGGPIPAQNNKCSDKWFGGRGFCIEGYMPPGSPTTTNIIQYLSIGVGGTSVDFGDGTHSTDGANMTDGLDGLATGTSAIIGAVLALFAYVSDNTEFASYLNIMLIPGASELAVYLAAFVGACVGFLWYNSYPAQVFMGDTGSLSIGGIIAIAAILIRKELLIPILCGVFLVESLSVMIQVGYFKYTKKKYGVGKRVFKMAPIHHHFQKLGIHESKIVTRFWIAGIILAVLTIVTLKLR